MRIAYLDCSTGISGDMTLAALIDAGIDADAIRAGIASLRLPGVELRTESVMKCGFRATYVRVEHPEQHAHRHLSDIVRIIDAADALTPPQKELARRIFHAVAEAEAHVHGSTVEKIHFHEVGAIDSIVDIVGAAIGLDLLGAERIECSPLPTGRGQVTIAHGVCTVPTPGTAELLKGVPLVDVPVEAELTTPTGAAIVREVVDRFGPLPEMTVEAIGYGAGTRDLPGRANVLRLFVGTEHAAPETDRVVLLETNLDDVTGETIGYTKQKLLSAGALDAYSVPIQMKKDRPGVMLAVIAPAAHAERLETIVFDETGTFGIRRSFVDRSKRARAEHMVNTPWGPVRGKIGWQPAANSRRVFTPEFEDCARVASEQNIPLRDVYRAALAGFDRSEQKSLAAGDTGASALPTVQHHHDHDHEHHHHHDHDHDHDHDH
ncbi:MAG: nickel pincer cofactor biosynthesis protein LarC [Planctomycetaceae bacterium]